MTFGGYVYSALLTLLFGSAAAALALTGSKKLAHVTLFFTTCAAILYGIFFAFTNVDYQLQTTVRLAFPFIALLVYEWIIVRSLISLRRRNMQKTLLFNAAMVAAAAPLVCTKIFAHMVPFPVLTFGITYVSMRMLDICFSIKDGVVEDVPFVEFATFLFFFPTLSAGPIDRYRRFDRDWQHVRTRGEILQDVDGGVHRLVVGFFYSHVISILIWHYWLQYAMLGTSLIDHVSFAYAYTLYLFFNFAGYSAIAIGFSYFFGIHTPENFDKPFLARNIRDFWLRWHMSLSFWFRDHIYTRFVYAGMKGKWFGNERTLSYCAYMLTMILMGLWHGFTFGYLLYGIYMALLLIGYDVFHRWHRAHRHSIPFAIPRWISVPLSVFITFHFVCFGLYIFSGQTMTNSPATATEIFFSRSVLQW